MLLVTPLARMTQRRPFEDDSFPPVEACPEVTWEVSAKTSTDMKEMRPALANKPRRSSSTFEQSQVQRPCLPRAQSVQGGIEVALNIYDVTHDSTIQQINGFFANQWSPLKFGGIFHVGIEIHNVEWSYGSTVSGTGVVAGLPRSERQHHFRETVKLPETRLSLQEIDEVLRELVRQYKGADYHILDKNCCHFAEDLCERLGIGSLPAWVHRMGRLGDSLRKASTSFGDHVARLPRSCSSEGPSECRHKGADSKQNDFSSRKSTTKLAPKLVTV